MKRNKLVSLKRATNNEDFEQMMIGEFMEVVSLERATNNGDFEHMMIGEFMEVVYFKMWGKMSLYREEKWQDVRINIHPSIVLGIMEGGD